MGTNYYWHKRPSWCGCSLEGLHIGKSSLGWCFALRVYPEQDIESLADWYERWSLPGTHIRDEYGRTLTPLEMSGVIVDRTWEGSLPKRREIDGRHCVGHGEGTWDYMIGDFS